MKTESELVYYPKIEPIYVCNCGNTFCSNVFLMTFPLKVECPKCNNKIIAYKYI